MGGLKAQLRTFLGCTAQLAASLTMVLSVCPSAGPDANPGLVLEQKRAEEAAMARMASCPKHPSPMSLAKSIYVNYSFEHPASCEVGQTS